MALASPHPLPPPGRRGAPPGNSNARKHGIFSGRDPHPISGLFFQLRSLNRLQRASAAAPSELLASARGLLRQLDELGGDLSDHRNPLSLPAARLFLDVEAVIGRAFAAVGAAAAPHTRLLEIARSPL